MHDVYDSLCDDSTATTIQPRIAQFLSNLEVGSLVCDVGCGNGRYLNACNPFIFSIGVDRCVRLAKEACSRGQVAVGDNLELPFRNESFDACLSLSVIHHFATAERRINAIRELSRILRIGGRVVITVWALEQKHRRFESQDVLIPTSSSISLNRNSRNNAPSDDEDEDEYLPPYHAYTEESTNSSRSAGDGDSSSLSSSSPGESCYSFVRKTIQKLAGGRRHPWFLDSWNSRENKNDNSLDFEDAKDLPIELRRLDDFEDLPEPPLSTNLKSRSLSSILNPPPQTIVRSLSSVPSLAAPDALKNGVDKLQRTVDGPGLPSAAAGGGGFVKLDGIRKPPENRPKLVKQKQSLCDEKSFVDIDEDAPRVLLRKQSSLNEEYLSEGRQREKERIRKRIHKQMSLNESFLYRSVFSKRLQVIREGLTTKLRTSSGSIERLKNNGIVRLIQNLKMSPQSTTPSKNGPSEKSSATTKNDPVDGSEQSPAYNNEHPQSVELDEKGKPRRRSRESGSDSSKDSLQSDTSIESEDSSFASVIYIPRPDQQQSSGGGACLHTPDSSSSAATMCPGAPNSNCNPCYSSTTSNTAAHCSSYSRTPTVPTSPLPCPTPAQSPAPLKTTPGHQQQQMAHLTGLGGGGGGGSVDYRDSDIAKESFLTKQQRFTFDFEIPDSTTENLLNKNSSHIVEQTFTKTKLAEAKPKPIKNGTVCSKISSSSSNCNKESEPQPSTECSAKKKFEIPPIPKFSGGSGHVKRIASFPILRRSAQANPVVPKLVSLEIYNPETDDSDSSEPSSPDSIDSVINALDGTTTKAKNILSGAEEDKEEIIIVAPERPETKDQPSLEEFAKQLNAQLLKELNENKLWEDLDKERPSSGTSSSQEFDVEPAELTSAERKQRSNLRDELRSRRLMLANLNGSSSSLKRFSSQFSSQFLDGPDPDLTIHEEEDDATDKDTDLLQCSAICDTTTRPEAKMEQQRNVGNGFVVGQSSPVPRRPVNEDEIPLIENEGAAATDYRHSHSSTSLESPGGGSVTHHRYYHVFREGELDALINHHVLDLHITSSYYERSMWCIVAEKVQVWTI